MTNTTEQQHQYFFFHSRFFLPSGVHVVIDKAFHPAGCDVKQSESADRKCAGFNIVRIGYGTRSYKMYKTPSSNYKQHTLEEKNVPCFNDLK